MEEELIVVKKSKLKSLAQRFLTKFYSLYIDTLRETTLFWRRVFSSDSRILTLLESDALVLFFNTILFAFVGVVFRGLIGNILLNLCLLNILMFLFKKAGWIDQIMPQDKLDNIEDDLGNTFR